MFKNLHNTDNMLKTIKSQGLAYEKLILMYHNASNSTFKRSVIMGMVHRLSENLNQLKRDWADQMFIQSPYGVKIMDNERQVRRYIIKGESDRYINAYLYDRLGSSDIEKYLKPLSAREALNKIDDGLNDVSRSKKQEVRDMLKIKAREEMDEFRKSVGWTEQKGFSVVSKKAMWLYVGNSLTKNMFLKDKTILNSDQVVCWEGVLFERSRHYDHHYAPKNWIMGDNRIMYPLAWAKDLNMEIRLSIPNSQTMPIAGKINDLNLTFSHAVGYFDGSKYAIESRTLVNPSDTIQTARGDTINRILATFVPRHNAWYANSRVNTVRTEDGSVELRDECLSIHGRFYHQTDPSVSRCPSCGTNDFTDQMSRLDDEDENAELVCRECVGNMGRQLNRMCYSTDVLDHKGFGTTNTKINGKGVFVGLELEVYADFNSGNKKEVLIPINKFAMSKKNTYCVATSDGSLSSSNGVEYIFRPEGLNQQKHNVHEFVNGVGRYLCEDAGDGYGLHIHVSSHFLSELEKVRIDNFIATFEKYFRKIGARGKTEYQEAKRLHSNQELRYSDHSKYRMLNISKPQTIEFRFPKSLVNEVHINMNLELALAVTMFCKYNLSNVALNTKVCSAMALRKFIQYVARNKKQYPLLNAEHSANIDLTKLEKYSKYYREGVTEFQTEDVTYALCA